MINTEHFQNKSALADNNVGVGLARQVQVKPASTGNAEYNHKIQFALKG